MATFFSGRRTALAFPTEPEQFTIKSLCLPDPSRTDDSAAQPRSKMEALCTLTVEAFSVRCRLDAFEGRDWEFESRYCLRVSLRNPLAKRNLRALAVSNA